MLAAFVGTFCLSAQNSRPTVKLKTLRAFQRAQRRVGETPKTKMTAGVKKKKKTHVVKNERISRRSMFTHFPDRFFSRQSSGKK